MSVGVSVEIVLEVVGSMVLVVEVVCESEDAWDPVAEVVPVARLVEVVDVALVNAAEVVAAVCLVVVVVAAIPVITTFWRT